MATYSPNPYLNMTVAASLLRPTVSFSQLRADRDRNLMLQSAITQQAQANEQAAQQASLVAQQQLYSIYKQDFLQPDQDRWRTMMDGIRSQIGERVKKDFGGDYARYAKTMYIQDLQNLTQQAYTSPLYTKAQNNKLNYARLLADQSKGLIDRPVQYRTADGAMKAGSARDNYLDFVTGRTDELLYNGGYEIKPGWQKSITERYSPRAKDTFTKDFARPDEIYSALVGNGVSPEDAQDYLGRFGKTLGPIMYKFDPRDPYKDDASRRGWAQVATGQRNARTAERRANLAEYVAMQKLSGGGAGLSPAQITFGPGNELKDDKGNSVVINGTYYDESLKPLTTKDAKGRTVAAPAASMKVYDGGVYSEPLLKAMGGKVFKDTKAGVQYISGVKAGAAYLAVPNAQNGIDLRKTDLSGLKFNIVETGNIIHDTSRPLSATEAATRNPRSNVPGRFMQEVVVEIPESEAVKAKNGKLLSDPLTDTFLGSHLPGYVKWGVNKLGGVIDETPLSKGAGEKVKMPDGRDARRYRMMIEINPTDAQKYLINEINKSAFQKAGAAMMQDAVFGGMNPLDLANDSDND